MFLNIPIVSWLLTFRYPIVFPLAIVEGPLVMLISGFLIRIGFFSFWPIYLILMAGDLTGDIFWYFVGRKGGRPLIEKYGHYVNLTEENVERAEGFFQDHQTKILFISKITMGFGFALATLVAAGMANVSFKKYFTINLFGQFIWTGILIGAGYFLGNFYTWVDKSLRWAFVISLIIIAAFAIFGFGKFMRRQFGAKI